MGLKKLYFVGDVSVAVKIKVAFMRKSLHTFVTTGQSPKQGGNMWVNLFILIFLEVWGKMICRH
jgi:hypothetical protein